tara:strand:+ start:234 stop:935 length:702 start_codon:yes stop_codon:yes gene_type:complete
MLRGFLEKAFKLLARNIQDAADFKNLHPKRILLEEAQQDSADYVRNNMANALILDRRDEILNLALDRMLPKGLVLEFGVAGGDSLSYMAKNTNRIIHGFDSFEGLPDDWPGRHESKGHYSTDGKLPKVPDNTILHKGWFENTLPIFLANDESSVAMVHIDCDLYSSTRTVLNLLAPRIQSGTIIIFDEYFNFIGWRDHEFLAFREFTEENNVRYSYLAWSYQQAIVVIDEMNS